MTILPRAMKTSYSQLHASNTFYEYFAYMYVCVSCMCIYLYHLVPEEGIGSPGTGVKDSHESRYLELNLGPLQEQ